MINKRPSVANARVTSRYKNQLSEIKKDIQFLYILSTVNLLIMLFILLLGVVL